MEEGTTLYCGDNCNHTGPCHRRPPAGVATMIAAYHQHHWVYDGFVYTQGFVYHCDAHDPPLVRVVRDYVPFNPPDQVELGPVENGHNCLRDD